MLEYGLTEACGYVQVRDNIKYLTSQTDVPYTSLLLDEDIHRSYKDEVLDLEYLADLEKRIGNPTLWQFIAADRIVRYSQLVREYPYNTPMYSHTDMLRLAQAYAKKITAFLQTEKPDFIFMPQPGGLGTLLLFYLARSMGIQTQVIVIPGLANRTCISEVFEKLSGVEALLAGGDIEPSYITQAQEAIREFREKPRSYSRAYDPQYVQHTRKRQLQFLSFAGFHWTISFGYRMVRDWMRNTAAKGDYSTIHPWHYYLDRFRRKVTNFVGYNDLYDSFDENISYGFFPLNLEPELSLLVQAPFSLNQIEAIGHIAQSLPVGMILYVKEHPQMVGYRPRSYYKELKKIPNVRLLRPSIPGVQVMQDSRIVFTIAGTAGFEAALFKKPIISFGKLYYNELSFVRRSATPEELPHLIREQLSHFGFNEDELVRFVAALFKDSAHVDFAHLWAFEYDVLKIREESKDLTHLLAHKVGLQVGM